MGLYGVLLIITLHVYPFVGIFYLKTKIEMATEHPVKRKPLPSSSDELERELQSVASKLQTNCKPTLRERFCCHMVSSANIKRPLQTAMILLVGVTGAGKSSTLNHFLDMKEGDPVALTNDAEPETRETSEYVLGVDDPDSDVCELTISIVDTPGLNDTEGENQDACNVLSIQSFFKTHPSFRDKQIYPNLVFLVVKATDDRVKGPKSNLTKCLRGIKLLNVVDKNHPNLVVVVTACCSSPYGKPDKWMEKMKKKKSDILTVVFEVLGVHAPVVLLENEYEDYGLQRDGDFTLLPNKERQPKNLYEACLKLLDKSKDYFGLAILNSAFRVEKKYRPKIGHTVKAKDSSVDEMSVEQKQFSSAFNKAAAKGGRDKENIIVSGCAKKWWLVAGSF